MSIETSWTMSSNRPAIDLQERPAPRQGRPRRLSHEAVLDAALKLLGEIPLESFTLAKLAQKLGASTMSLYTYYPSRDGLLEAVAERAFHLFVAPEPRGAWQDRVLDWLWALQRHVDLHPIATKLMAWNGRVPIAWLRIWAPILTLLNEQGLEGRALAVSFDWFINAAIGLIVTQHSATEAAKSAAVGDIGAFGPEEGMLLLRFFYDLQSVERDTRFALGFHRLIEGLEACIAEAGSGTLERHGA
jgi:AcrR family transcriptional regulator